MLVRITAEELRQIIRETLEKKLNEVYVKSDVPNEVYQSLAIKFESFGITTYSSYWLSSAAIAWANHDDEKFIISLFNSIATAGISSITREKNGKTFAISISADQALDLDKNVKNRLRILKDIGREDLVPKLNEQYRNFLEAKAAGLTLDAEEMSSIEDHIKSLGEEGDIISNIQKIISNTTDPGKVLSNTMARAILQSPSKLSNMLGSLICIVEPEAYKDLSDKEKEALRSAEAKKIDPFTGNVLSSTQPLQGQILESVSAPPQAEVIAVQTKNTAQPIAIVNVFKTLVKSLPEIQQENKDLFKNEYSIAWIGQYVQPTVVNLSDVFSNVANRELNGDFNPTLSRNDKFKESLFDLLTATSDMSPEKQFEVTRLLKIDLRAIEYPSKIFTREGQESASQFMCPVDSVGEAIRLGWGQDENDDLSAVCKVYIADSLSFNLGLALVQMFQSVLLESIGGLIGGALTTAGAGTGAAVGVVVGKIVNAYVTIAENLATQILPLVNGSVYFWSKGNMEAAAALLGRAVVQVMFTILQVGAQEFGSIVKATPSLLTPAGRALSAQELTAVFKKSAGSSGTAQLAGLIGGVLIDSFLTLELSDAVNPGSKDLLINQVKSLFTDVKLDEDSLKAMRERMKGAAQADVLKINDLYKTYEQMTIASQYSQKLKDLKIKDN